MPTRYLNVALGVWLFLSAFLWVHSQAQLTNTWLVGLLAIAFALVSLRVPEARYLTTALAIWLFVSVWALPILNVATAWNNALVAIAMFMFSLMPGVRSRAGPPPAG